MRGSWVVAVCLVGVSAGLLWGPRETAHACSIGPFLFYQGFIEADVVVRGTLTNTDELTATLEAEVYYRGAVRPAVLTIENRVFNTTPYCDPVFEATPRYEEGEVVAFLVKHEPGNDAEFMVMGLGQAILYIEDGLVEVLEQSPENGPRSWITVGHPLEEFERDLLERVGPPLPPDDPLEQPEDDAVPVPVATPESARLVPSGGVRQQPGASDTRVLLWGAAGMLVGASIVGTAWWARSRRRP